MNQMSVTLVSGATILSSNAEIHSFQLGILLAVSCIILKHWVHPKAAAGVFGFSVLGVYGMLGLLAPFFDATSLRAVEVVASQPWYFMTALVSVIGIYELYGKTRALWTTSTDRTPVQD